MSDYADAIAARIIKGNDLEEVERYSRERLANLLAQAAREGYALGYGAKS